MWTKRTISGALIAAIFVTTVFAGNIQLATNGQSSYVILIGSNVCRTERFAAEELQEYFEKITGAKLPIVTDTGKSPFIAIGDNSATKTCEVPSRYPGDDAVRIRSVDNNLIIKGAHPRATLFAVYAFLEELGCWFFSPDVPYLEPYNEYVPQKPTLSIEPTDVFQQPLMKHRRKNGDMATPRAKWIIEKISWQPDYLELRLKIAQLPQEQKRLGKKLDEIVDAHADGDFQDTRRSAGGFPGLPPPGRHERQ